MTERTFFETLRLRVFVTFLRPVVSCMSYFRVRRDNAFRLEHYKTKVERINIPSRDKGRTIEAYLYVPPSAAADPKPVIVSWHGSGFVLPMLGSDNLYCGRLATEVGAYVIDADYRKAPEHPFPAAVEDVEDALEWLSTQPARFDSSRVAVSGFSAGANLALVAASVLRKNLKVSVKAVAAIYPVTNISVPVESKHVPHPLKPMPASIMNLFNDSYAPDPATRKDPRISPAFANLEDFPSTVIIETCSGDVLAPEGQDLAQKLDVAGRKVVLVKMENVPHGFDKGAPKGTRQWDEREKGYAAVVKTLKETFSL